MPAAAVAGIVFFLPATEPVPAAGHDSAAQSEELVLSPGRVHEICLQLTPANEWRYTFTATGKLNFNLHYHEDGVTLFPFADQPLASVESSYQPPVPQTYCLMWTNKTLEDVDLKISYTIALKS